VNIVPRNILIVGLIALFMVLVAHGWLMLHSQSQRVHRMKQYYSLMLPSLNAVQSFILMTNQSKMLSVNWVYLPADGESKASLRKLQQEQYPILKDKLLKYSIAWSEEQSTQINLALIRFDTLIAVQENGIMANLVTIDNYEDPLVKLLAEDAVESAVIPRANAILTSLTTLAEQQRIAMEAYEKEAVQTTIDDSRINSLFIIAAVTIGLLCLIMSLFIVRSVQPHIPFANGTTPDANAALTKIRIIEWIAKTENEELISQLDDIHKSTSIVK
ncbi:hypothetical protein, partial [Ohtaekwangia sp.]|uniref:hypothetical protein n=1 Tax=Ohtaekwangia sp. TaxID=2066019 RepID=UPI002FDCD04F